MALDIQDPRITRTMRTGYPHPVDSPKGKDFFGNVVYPGDEILEFEDEVFIVDEISTDLQEFLEFLGARYRTAK